MKSWKSILVVAAVTLLAAACGGSDNPPGSDGGASSSDASDDASASDQAQAEMPLPPDNYVGQPAPSISADDDHPQTQWKSRTFQSNVVADP